MQIGIDFYILAVLLFLACIVMIFRRCQSRRKLKHMTESEKAEKLSALTKPFGFARPRLYAGAGAGFLSHALDALDRHVL